MDEVRVPSIAIFIKNDAATIPTPSLASASITSDAAVGNIFCFPWKYPRKTDAIATKNTAGEIARIPIAEPGTETSFSNCSLNINNNAEPTKPIIARKTKAVWNILCASLRLFFAVLYATIFEMAIGKPAVATININVYI